jgi:hypothetical protein
MTQSERFEYHLVVRDDANPAIQQTGQNAVALAGKADTVRSSFAGLSRDMKAFAGRDLGNFSAGLKAGQERLEKTSGALAAMSSALGQSESMIAKVGQAGVQLAATFAVGGGVLTAIVATVGILSKLKDQTDENRRAEGVWRQQLIELGKTIRDDTQKSIKDLRDGMLSLKKATEDYGKTTYEVAIAEASSQKAAYEAKLKNIEATNRLRQAAVNEAQSLLESARLRGRGIAEAEERLEIAKTIQAQVARNAKEYESAVTSLEDTVWGIADAWAAVDQRTRDAAGAAAYAAQTAALLDPPEGDADWNDRFTQEDPAVVAERRFAAQEKVREDARQREFAAEQAQEARILAAKQEADRILADMELAGLEERLRMQREAWQGFASEMADVAISGFGIAAAGAQQLTADLITGQDKALEHFAANVMAQAGQSLIASGVKLAGEAAVSAFTPGLQPVAAAQGATAAALIGTGIGLGGASVGIEHLLAGGAIGQALPEKSAAARREKGIGSVGGPGGAVTPGTSITIVYDNLSAPSAEDGVAKIAKATGVAQERGMLTTRRRVR